MKEERFGGTVDVGEPPGLPPLFRPATRSCSAWGERPDPTTDKTAKIPHTTAQMALAAVTPTVRAATKGLSEPSLGHSNTARTA